MIRERNSHFLWISLHILLTNPFYRMKWIHSLMDVLNNAVQFTHEFHSKFNKPRGKMEQKITLLLWLCLCEFYEIAVSYIQERVKIYFKMQIILIFVNSLMYRRPVQAISPGPLFVPSLFACGPENISIFNFFMYFFEVFFEIPNRV